MKPLHVWPLVLSLLGCGGSIPQAPACEQYTACIRALDEARGIETDLDRFDPGGGCWHGEEGALLCERACIRGLEFESRRAAPDPMECQP